ncbi:MAG TPA: hypothetical protein ENN43_08020 [bacterium]|nr:hypothetical protein [bacterium]
MKRFISAVVFTVLLFPAAITGHPPSDAEFEYKAEKKMLKISIIHNVRSEKSHYINEIELKLNGKDIIRQKASVQTDLKGQRVVYVIPEINEGDEVEVSANCNVFGKKSFKHKIEAVKAVKEK